ncbi:MAG: type I polyketide synthase [Frankiaceae bacterium]
MRDSATSVDKDELLKRLLLEKYEPIAVVGIGLRLPGGNETVEDLAAFLREGREGIGPVPLDRWDARALHADEPGARGGITTAGGGFLSGIDLFDARFFNVSPKEAAYLDPQQRLALAASWHALESANIDPAALRGGNGGVYVGASAADYALEAEALSPEELDAYVDTGTMHSVLSGRLSYFLGWRGPCMSIDAACASSLVALHLAAKGLRQRECDIALAGGVSTITHPRHHIVCSQANMLSRDGRCKTFDESADGYGRSEGVGMLVLKRLSDAKRDGNRILALVRGSAVRQDGERGSLTMPNGHAQTLVMRAALADAMLEPGDVGYVEAHGTGTSLGDPVEMTAINAVFGTARSKDDPIAVGSLKTNIGHMEAAAGAGGVIKAVLQLRDGVLYPHLNMTAPSKRIAWSDYHVTVPSACTPWRDPVRRALVNSFGYAGTIASVVLEQPPSPAATSAASTGDAAPAGTEPCPILTLSARTAGALPLQARAWRDALDALPEADLAAFCRTGNVGRSHFPVRAAAPVTSVAQARAFLDDVIRTGEEGRLPKAERLDGVAFLFTGQAPQHAGTGRQLHERYPAFREQVDLLDALFEPCLGRSVRAVMLGEADPPGPDTEQSRVARCALFALELSVARLWIGWGVVPDIVLGHGLGEVVAATIAGLLSVEDAVRLAAARARLLPSAPAPLLDAFAEEIRDIGFREPAISFVSTVTGDIAKLDEVGTIDHWVRHIGAPVRLTEGLERIKARGRHLFLEIGPSGGTTGAAQEAAGGAPHLWIRSMSPADAGGDAISSALARCYAAGVRIDWAAHHAGHDGRLLDLPPYAFDARRHWLPLASRPLAGPSAGGTSALLGVESTTEQQRRAGIRELRAMVSPRRPAYLADHVVMGRVVLPASGYVELVLALQDLVHGETVRPIEDLRVHEPLLIPDESPVDLRTRLSSEADGTATVEIVSVVPDGRHGTERLHATATIGELPAPGPALAGTAEELRALAASLPSSGARRSPDDLHAELAGAGLSFGPSFRQVTEIALLGDGLVDVTVGGIERPDGSVLHPAVLVGIVQAVTAAAPAGHAWLPTRFDAIELLKKPRGQLRALVRVRQGAADGELAADVLALEGQRPVLVVRGLRLQRAASAPSATSAPSGTSAVVEEALRAKLAAVLAFPSLDDIEPDAKLSELGMSSLAALKLKNALEATLGIPLTTAMVFDHPTVADLARHLADQLARADGAAEGLTDDERRAAALEVEGLTDAEVQAELAALQGAMFRPTSLPSGRSSLSRRS